MREYCEPYYKDRDVMHNMWRIKLVEHTVDKTVALGGYEANRDVLTLATYFHGFVYGAQLDFMRDNVLAGGKCYLHETIPLCEEMNRFTKEFYRELVKGIE